MASSILYAHPSMASSTSSVYLLRTLLDRPDLGFQMKSYRRGEPYDYEDDETDSGDEKSIKSTAPHLGMPPIRAFT